MDLPARRRAARWFPHGRLVDWKYDVDGNRDNVIALGNKQIAECRTDACVANGPAYGPGSGVVTAPGECAHCPGTDALFAALEKLLR